MNPPAHFDFAACAGDLRAHHALCEEVLLLVTRDHQVLGETGSLERLGDREERERLVRGLDESLGRMRHHRRVWQGLRAEERARYSEMAVSLRATQDLVMRAIVLDRENEQALLRRGQVPARQMPPLPRQQPHFVANLYRRYASI